MTPLLQGLRMLTRISNRQSIKARRKVLSMLPTHSVGVEIGVWKGDFSARILKAVHPLCLHLVDPWLVSEVPDRATTAWYGANNVSQREMDEIHATVLNRFASAAAQGQVVVHRAEAKMALAGIGDASVDFVYIDGDHSYEAVRSDLADAYRITKTGGLICCDDYSLGSWWKDGVVRAAHEFMANRPIKIVCLVDTQLVLRKLDPEQFSDAAK